MQIEESYKIIAEAVNIVAKSGATPPLITGILELIKIDLAIQHREQVMQMQGAIDKALKSKPIIEGNSGN